MWLPEKHRGSTRDAVIVKLVVPAPIPTSDFGRASSGVVHMQGPDTRGSVATKVHSC